MITPKNEVLREKAPEPGKFSPEQMAQFKKWGTQLDSKLSLKRQLTEATPRPDPEKKPDEAERYDVAQESVRRRMEAAHEIQASIVA